MLGSSDGVRASWLVMAARSFLCLLLGFGWFFGLDLTDGGGIPTVTIEGAFACEEPEGGDLEIGDEEVQPRRLEDVGHGVFLEGTHIPAVDAVAAREGLPATDDFIVDEVSEGGEETDDDFLTWRGLHDDKGCMIKGLIRGRGLRKGRI